MNQRTKQRIGAIAGIAGVATALVGALGVDYAVDRRAEIQERQRQEEFQRTQEDLLAVDRYLGAIDNPEAYDGAFSLGWTMQVPNRYREFVKQYEEGK